MTQTPPISAEGFRTDWSGLRNLLDSSISTIEKQTTFEMRSAHLDELARVLEAGIAASIPVSRGAETEGVDTRALDITKRIEREFYYDHPGGAVQTRARVQAIIAEVLAALPAPQPVEEQEPFATAWQTSYTGDQWHFDRKVSFAPADIERGIVRNITPLAALVKP